MAKTNSKSASSGKDGGSDSTDLHDNGVHLLSGEFDYDTAKDFITWLLESNYRKTNRFDHLTLIINSHGGDLCCAFAMIDMMRGSSIPVHTVGIGQISSCGLLLFLAGQKGHRTLTPNTTIMSHMWSGGMFGTAHEMIAAQRDVELTTQRMITHYQTTTGLSIEEIKAKLLPANDVFLSAEEALALNICDHIQHVR